MASLQTIRRVASGQRIDQPLCIYFVLRLSSICHANLFLAADRLLGHGEMARQLFDKYQGVRLKVDWRI